MAADAPLSRERSPSAGMMMDARDPEAHAAGLHKVSWLFCGGDGDRLPGAGLDRDVGQRELEADLQRVGVLDLLPVRLVDSLEMARRAEHLYRDAVQGITLDHRVDPGSAGQRLD